MPGTVRVVRTAVRPGVVGVRRAVRVRARITRPRPGSRHPSAPQAREGGGDLFRGRDVGHASNLHAS